jgi:lipopolysaccharide export system permease protein
MPGALAAAAARGGSARDLKARSRFGIIALYAAKEFLYGFAVCFLFFFAVFFVNNFLLMAEEILSKKAPPMDVLLLLFYAMPRVLAMSFPFAALVGALMAAGRLASDNEALAAMAAGIPPARVFGPFMLLGLAISLVSFSMNDYFIPRGNLEFQKLYRKLAASTPALELTPWSTKTYDEVTVVTGDMKDGRLTEMLIFDGTEAGSERVISAGSARLGIDDERGDVILYLEDVWQQIVRKSETDRFEWAEAASMEYRIAAKGESALSSSKGPSDMTSRDLAKVIDGKDAALEARRLRRADDMGKARIALAEAYDAAADGLVPWANSAERLRAKLASVTAFGTAVPTDRTLDVYKTEYYKKYSIPFGAICFVVLAFPVGMLARRAGRATGFGVGILVSVLYWALLVGGTSLSSRLGWSPLLSSWMPNFAILAAGIAFWAARLKSR